MPLTRKRNDGQGTALTTALQTILTFSAGLAGAGGILQHVVLVNMSGANRTVTLQLVESGGAPANSRIIGKLLVPANDTAYWQGPVYANSQATVQALMDGGTAGDVNAYPVALEVS